PRARLIRGRLGGFGVVIRRIHPIFSENRENRCFPPFNPAPAGQSRPMTQTAIPENPGLPPEPPPPPGSDWALFLDIDGTLLDIAETPDQVLVPPALRANLDIVAGELGGALALVSGRPVSDIDRLFDPLRLPASGQHGGEWRPQPQQATEVIAGQTVPQHLRHVADDLLLLHPGI